jgi:hypothetical protein
MQNQFYSKKIPSLSRRDFDKFCFNVSKILKKNNIEIKYPESVNIKNDFDPWCKKIQNRLKTGGKALFVDRREWANRNNSIIINQTDILKTENNTLSLRPNSISARQFDSYIESLEQFYDNRYYKYGEEIRALKELQLLIKCRLNNESKITSSYQKAFENAFLNHHWLLFCKTKKGVSRQQIVFQESDEFNRDKPWMFTLQVLIMGQDKNILTGNMSFILPYGNAIMDLNFEVKGISYSDSYKLYFEIGDTKLSFLWGERIRTNNEMDTTTYSTSNIFVLQKVEGEKKNQVSYSELDNLNVQIPNKVRTYLFPSI